MNEKVTQQASESRQDRARKMMLWFGIASLIMTFAGWTSAYIVSSTREDWMSDFQLPPAFWFSTVVIVLSSFTYWLAFRSVKGGQARAGHLWLALTLVLGMVFIASQFRGFSQQTAFNMEAAHLGKP